MSNSRHSLVLFIISYYILSGYLFHFIFDPLGAIGEPMDDHHHQVATSVAEDGIFQRLAQSMAANPEARACLEADGVDGFVVNVLLRFCRPWNLKLRTNNLYATSNDYTGAYDYVRALGEGLKCYPE